MIHYLVTLLILSADGSPGMDGQFPQAAEVRHWDFEQGDDQNFDGWPDDWTRRRGRGYPLYLEVAIADDDQPRAGGTRSLHMNLDGGAALVKSPPMDVSPLFSYVLQGYLKTKGLKHDVAFASILFYDGDGNLLETHDSKHHRQTSSWTRFQIGPVIPKSQQVRHAVIALHVKPTTVADLTGAALFDDLWFGNLPRVSLTANSQHHLFTNPRDVQITCSVSGISHPNPLLRFELFDVDDNQLVEHEQAMKGDRLRTRAGRIFSGSAVWNPPIPGAGYYVIRVSMPGQTSDPISTTIAVLGDFTGSATGEFGWTLPNGDDPLTLKTLVSMLPDMGIHWVKFPVWYSDTDQDRADELAWFAERLSAHRIKLIGVLDQPPENVHELFGDKNDFLPVASVFGEASVWQPAVDPVMTRLSLKVRWWQLGADTDTSFVNFPNLEQSLAEIRQGFSRFGQQINLGIAWRSIDETPLTKTPPWSFLSYIADPPLTTQELTRYLSEPRHSSAKRWLILEPIAKSEYTLETRSQDLVSRMLTAKMERTDGIFVPDPFDPEHGLMNSDGTPSKMLLPWRTTAKLIAGAEYLGSLSLPNGSPNHIFARDDEAVMVVWNETATKEVIYLGEDVDQIDVWGRKTKPKLEQQDGVTRQEIQVSQLPTFVTGVDPAIARWRMSFRFETDRIASVFGQEQIVDYWFTNSYDQGVGGTIRAHTVWEAAPTEEFFKLSAHEANQRQLEITLAPNASSGRQPVRIDFEIIAARTHRFSIYRNLHVGLGDVIVNATSRLDASGNLLIEQRLTNNTDQLVSFNCLLSNSKRRRERRQVFNRGRGTTSIVFVLPNGAELLGETMWLRVEEIDGPRILNHQIIAHE